VEDSRVRAWGLGREGRGGLQQLIQVVETEGAARHGVAAGPGQVGREGGQLLTPAV